MSPEPPPPTAVRVVIVDDTPDLRNLLTLALRREGGYDVVAQAGNGHEGISVVEVTQPDLVLLDIAMPIMDGLEALPLIKHVCPRATVVMLSGFGAAQMTERAISQGADGYIQKGIPVRDLVARVAEHLARSADGSSG